MVIKVLGTGCKSCKQLYENTKVAMSDLSIEAELLYVTDMMEIAKSGIMRTPGLMIDRHVLSNGKVLSTDEIKKVIKAHINK